MNKRKPKLLIIGHARHGKDTVAQMIADTMGLKFASSSHFVGEECIWDAWGKERYDSFEAMFADRVNYRKTWADLISAYNTPNKARTAETMLNRGNDMYVGMRKLDEFDACEKAMLFDYVIWVDRSKHLPNESIESMELRPSNAEISIDNNGSLKDTEALIKYLRQRLHHEGFDVVSTNTVFSNYTSPDPIPDPIVVNEFKLPTKPVPGGGLTWKDAPVGATKVLDHGFIQNKGVFGSDEEICEAARMSYGRGTKKVNNDAGLINYLLHNHHTSPLEMGAIKFHIRLPIFVMRQLIRHRTAKLNEYSGRYSEMVRLFYVPELEHICVQDKVNKQGSAEPLNKQDADIVRGIIFAASAGSFDDYELLLKKNVSRETARIILPLNTYTETVWQIDISNLIKLLYQRLDLHAQYEIRVYAEQMEMAMAKAFPLVYAAFRRERDRVSLTQEQIHVLINGQDGNATELGKGELMVVSDLIDRHLNISV